MSALRPTQRLIVSAVAVATTTLVLATVGTPQSPDSPLGRDRSPVDASKLPQRLNVAALPNAYRMHEKVISGGLPDGDAAFVELARLGVKTIISVDGAKPDVATARRHGLRYVHLPHGYDGISEERARQLAKAVRALPGPIYIHCHHGKHRSPAAAAVACVELGFLDNREAVAFLRTAGTSEHYRGLYQATQAARRLDDDLLDALPAEFPASAVIPPLAQAMVDIQRQHDHLKAIARAGWKPPSQQPALVPAHEALLLREQFTEMARTAEVQARPPSFRQLVLDSQRAATELESALRTSPWSDAAAQAAVKSHERLTALCTACHRQHRD